MRGPPAASHEPGGHFDEWCRGAGPWPGAWEPLAAVVRPEAPAAHGL